jgi:glutamate-5-semialdehyde dehydrogenase
LIHESIAKDFAPIALKALHDAGVVLHGDARTLALAGSIPITLATDENFCTE